MADIIHFPPPSNNSDDPEKLFASALEMAGHHPKMRKAVEDAYAAGYLQAVQEAVQMMQEVSRLLQEKWLCR